MDNSNFFTIEQAKILVVDDNPNNLELLARILEKQNHEVRGVSRGAKALEIAESGWAELILLDIKMPEMNGYEICKQLKANDKTKDIPVIFLSALDNYLDKVKAFQAGGLDYITKPIQSQEVLIRVKNQLTIQKTQHTIQLLNKQLEAKINQRTAELEAVNQKLRAEVKQRQQAQDKLLQLALNDPTTGLPNRNAFLGQLKQLLTKYQKQSNEQFAILLVSCNLIVSEKLKVGFPEIKCYLDHLALNQLLIAVANRLQSCLPASITLSRCEGNEFAIVLEHITAGKSEILQWVEIIKKQFDKPFDIVYVTLDKQEKRQELNIASTIGVVIANNDYLAAYDILHDAEIAVCQAQVKKENNYYFFNKKVFNNKQLSTSLIDDDSVNFIVAVKQLKSHFKEAIKREKINLYYQPIFSFKNPENLELKGLEVLSNRDSYKQLVSLTSFFKYIDKSKLNVYFSNFTLDYACYYIKKLQQQHGTQQSLFLTMQFTKQYLLQSQLVNKIKQILYKIQLDPEYLHLDIVGDNSTLTDKHILHLIPKLASLGVKLNLNYVEIPDESIKNISNLPFHNLKIPSFMTAQITSKDSAQNFQISSEQSCSKAEISKIIDLAHKNNIAVTAKGIDNQEHFIYLKSLGCDYGQGNLFSQPLDIKSLNTFLVWRI